jgi:hypothetical protein
LPQPVLQYLSTELALYRDRRDDSDPILLATASPHSPHGAILQFTVPLANDPA